LAERAVGILWVIRGLWDGLDAVEGEGVK